VNAKVGWWRLVGDRGATAVEYGLMVLLIGLFIIAAVVTLGENLSTFFNDTAASV
jgi:pilus assembly protein Flp/PilA